MVINIPNLFGILVFSVIKYQCKEDNVSSYDRLVRRLLERRELLPSISISTSHPVISSFRSAALNQICKRFWTAYNTDGERDLPLLEPAYTEKRMLRASPHPSNRTAAS